MSYQVIARKYRPQRFSEIVGQDHITKTLQNAILADRVHHAYLFTGIRGIGKTTLARIFSKILNCQAPSSSPLPEPCNKCQSCLDITGGSSIDVQEIDGASNTGVEDVRDIRERVKFLPATGKYKIYIIDEVHMLSTAAFNALLKTLEEPPSHVIFIFATTEVQKIPATILSRCQRYDFRRITGAKTIDTLKAIAKTEGVEIDDECLETIAAEAEGSMRDAESLFDQVIAYGGKKITFRHIKDLLGFLDQRQLNETIEAVIARDSSRALAVADELFSGGENMSRFALELLNRFHFLLVIKACKEPPKGTRISDAKFLKDVAERVTIEECQQWFNLLYRGAEDIARSKFPKIVLDVLLVNLTLVRPISGIDALIERVEALKEAGEKSPAVAQSVIPAKAGISREPAPAKEPVAQQTADTARPATPDQSWGAFVEWLKLNRPQVASYLDPSSGGSFLDGTLAIKFPRKCFASDQLNDADKKAFLEKLASDFCKRPIKVDLSFDSQEGPVDTKKQNREEIAAKNREIKDEALHHDVIKDTAGIFGAEITEIKVK